MRPVVALLALLTVATSAAADPCPAPTPNVAPDLSRPLHLTSDSVVRTDGGSVVRLPPGRYLRDDLWSTLDAEVKRLQDAETRLTATNASLRASLATWQPGWMTLLVVTATGVAAGWWLHEKL